MTAETKACPHCGEQILAVALKCRFCRQYLDAGARPVASGHNVVDRMLLPVDRPVSAIAAGYLGLISVIPIVGFPLAVLAVIFGVAALKKINADDSLAGKGRAWFGIIVGGSMILFSFLAVIMFFLELASSKW